MTKNTLDPGVRSQNSWDKISCTRGLKKFPLSQKKKKTSGTQNRQKKQWEKTGIKKSSEVVKHCARLKTLKFKIKKWLNSKIRLYPYSLYVHSWLFFASFHDHIEFAFGTTLIVFHHSQDLVPRSSHPCLCPPFWINFHSPWTNWSCDFCCVPGSSLLPSPYWKVRRPSGRGWAFSRVLCFIKTLVWDTISPMMHSLLNGLFKLPSYNR